MPEGLRHSEDLVVKICEILKHWSSDQLDPIAAGYDEMGEFERRIYRDYHIEIQWSKNAENPAIRFGLVTHDGYAIAQTVYLRDMAETGPSYFDAMVEQLENGLDEARMKARQLVLPTAVARELGREQNAAQGPPTVH